MDLGSGHWVGFYHHGLVFGTTTSGTSATTWIPLAAFSARAPLPTFWSASRTVVDPYLLGTTPLTSITAWHYWPVGLTPAYATIGWIAEGTDAQGRAITAWEWDPAGVLHERWVYTSPGVSAAQAYALVKQLGFTINTAMSPRLINPGAPE